MLKNKEFTHSVADLEDSARFTVHDSPRARGYFTQKAPIRVDQALLTELKKIHGQLGDRNVRLCLHPGPESLNHEMLILERKGRYYRPHRHEDKGETFHMIEGRMGVFSFSESGEVLDACVLEPGNCFIYKVQACMNHAVMPLTETVIYFESKPGPFAGENDSIFPEWAPDGRNEEEVKVYTDRLKQCLEA